MVGGTHWVNGNIICGNAQYGARLHPGTATVDATGKKLVSKATVADHAA